MFLNINNLNEIYVLCNRTNPKIVRNKFFYNRNIATDLESVYDRF